MHAIELDRVSKRFSSSVWAMKDVAFSAMEGEFVSLLGPSGCGKTTTLRVIAGFETATSGEIKFGGMSVASTPPWKRNIGIVFQTYALFPYLTAAENIAFGLNMRQRPKEEIRSRVEKALKMVGLAELGERYPRQMSGGQRQRVALARAMVIEPRLLLLDEPLSNLDAKLRGEMRLEVKRLQRESGITTVFVTHDQQEAFSLSDKIVLMKEGRVEQIGTPQDIWNHPRSRFVADFIGIENLLAGTLEGSGGEAVVKLRGGYALPVDAHSCKPGPVFVAIRARDVELLEPEDENGIEAEVIDADYRGDTFALSLRTPLADSSMTVQVPAAMKWSQNLKIALPKHSLTVLGDG
jgi:ABC-type Fe3+/spermidine/putrescine transport system ATPase subunit